MDEIQRIPTCGEENQNCDKSGYLCVKRTITAVGDIYSKGYKTVSQNDPTMVVGGVRYNCRKTEYANELVALTGIESKTTTVTATYEFVDKALHAE